MVVHVLNVAILVVFGSRSHFSGHLQRKVSESETKWQTLTVRFFISIKAYFLELADRLPVVRQGHCRLLGTDYGF